MDDGWSTAFGGKQNAPSAKPRSFYIPAQGMRSSLHLIGRTDRRRTSRKMLDIRVKSMEHIGNRWIEALGTAMVDTQLAFDLGPPSRPDAAYFFALRPDAAAAQAMREVAGRYRRRYGLSGRPYGADRLHVSLVQAISRRGVRKDDVAAARRAAAGVRAAPFPVSFDRVCSFRGRDARPVALCCDAQTAGPSALRDILRRELIKAGLWPGPVVFLPHVTLMWDRRRVPDTMLDEPIRWTVEDFVLVQSLLGRSRHVDLARWSLRVRTRTE